MGIYDYVAENKANAVTAGRRRRIGDGIVHL